MKTIRPGQLVYFNNEAYIVLELRNLEEVILRSIDSKSTKIARSSELSKHLQPTSKIDTSFITRDDKDWEKAVERYELIKPLVHKIGRTAEDVKEVAENANRSITTIYRWLNNYEEAGTVSSLLRVPRSDIGKSRLDKEIEEVIDLQIKEHYLNEQRKSVTRVFEMVRFECSRLDLPPPHINTVYARVNKLEEKDVVLKRLGRKTAKQKYMPVPGSFPGAAYPNQVIQIDHTPVDLIIVDQTHRLPIGRPYLTIAIDVATKMIAGFYLTLEAPSAMSVGMCIAHAVCDKKRWLFDKGIDADWPFYGLMEKIHVDNAMEFQSKTLERACKQYSIIIENRPRGMPNYGGDVERAFKTFMEKVHELPGTTFSSVKDKLDYDSEGKACMTLEEFEMWFTIYIVYSYHHRPHKGNPGNSSPINMYNNLVNGTESTPGVGLPFPIDDERALRLHFMPYIERTIGRQGVVYDNIRYFSPNLRRWIGIKDKGTNKAKKFHFAIDPRDISTIFFLEPESEEFISIPYLDNTHPSISQWELKEVKRKYAEEFSGEINENLIFEGVRKMREQLEQSVEKTRLAKQSRSIEKRKRRNAERMKGNKNVKIPQEAIPETQTDMHEEEVKITPFTDVEF